MLIYADYIVIMATNIFDLQNKIDLIISYFKENDLVVNLDKTKAMMFKYGKKRKDTTKVYWEESIIEFVSMYTYLGVDFHSNLSTNPVCSQFLRKAKNAENQLFNVMWRCKMNTIDSRMKLYNSLVKSMLSYCSSIWGIDHLHKLEIFQNNFIRRMLNLPRKSPNWYGRLEFNCSSIECDYMKNLLHFWKKIYMRPKNSLIYICYHQLKMQCENIKMKTNWYRSFKSLLMKWECHDILDIESSTEDLPYLGINERIVSLVSRIRNRSQQLDILKMQSSTSMPLYQNIKTHCKTEAYLNSLISWYDISIIAQLRSNLS
jgi:hypothetical protein